MRHNDDMNPFIRSNDVKSLLSVLYSVVEGKTEETYVIVRNSRNYPMLFLLSQFVIHFVFLMNFSRFTIARGKQCFVISDRRF